MTEDTEMELETLVNSTMDMVIVDVCGIEYNTPEYYECIEYIINSVKGCRKDG